MEQVDIQVNYNEVYEKFFYDKSFYKILWGSAGSSKSYTTAQKIILRCINEDIRVWCFRKFSTSILGSVFETLKEVIETFGILHKVKVNKTDRIFTFVESGAVIRCSGLDDEEKIKSISEMTVAWVEEANEFEEQDINQIDLRMRGETSYYRELILTFNPVSELHWLKEKFFDNPVAGVKEKLFTLHTTWRDNAYLDDDYIQRLLNTHAHDANNYRVYVQGLWGRIITGQEFYKNFREEHHVKETQYKPGLPIHISFDFNVVPYISSTIWQVEGVKTKEGKKWIARGLDEITLSHPKNTTEDIVVYIEENYREWLRDGVVLYGDASGKFRKTSSRKTDYMIIQEVIGRYIIQSRVPRSNPLQQDVYNFISRLFFGTFPVEIEIHPEMKHLKEDYMNVLEDGDRGKIKIRARDPVSKQIVEKGGHCFVGDTITDYGKQIKDVEKGDVMRFGVVDKVFDNGVKEVNAYKIGNEVIRCTPDHSVMLVTGVGEVWSWILCPIEKLVDTEQYLLTMFRDHHAGITNSTIKVRKLKIEKLNKKPFFRNVYNISIKGMDMPYYFANGIGVRNCSDSADYFMMSCFKDFMG